jgi:KaiC/GvpD/RAD55 family RecA-like ATPase
MSKRLKLKPARTRALGLAPPKVRAVDSERALGALGAERFVTAAKGGSPLALATLRRGLLAALRSSGGRPTLEGASRRQKIPMSDADWQALEGIAARLKAEGSNVSAGQVASQLLSGAIAGCELAPSTYGALREGAPLRVSDVAGGVRGATVADLRRAALTQAQQAGGVKGRTTLRSIVDLPLRGLASVLPPEGIALVDKGADQPTTCIAVLGDAGGGKTTAATAIAHAVARDLSGVVLYITTELFSTELVHKLAFLGLEQARVLRGEAAEQARAGDFVSQHLALLGEAIGAEGIEQRALEAALELALTPIAGDLRVRCVVIDAFPPSSSGAERSGREAIVGLIQALEGRGISVVIVDEGGALGGYLPYVADIVIELRLERGSAGGAPRRKLSCLKSRYGGSLPDPRDLGIDSGRPGPAARARVRAGKRAR